jgi:hypothetical protein
MTASSVPPGITSIESFCFPSLLLRFCHLSCTFSVSCLRMTEWIWSASLVPVVPCLHGTGPGKAVT